MTDLEISKALALAIGHHKFDVRINALYGNLVVLNKCYDAYKWQVFDYRDWNVIGPIAEKLIVELIKGESHEVVYWEAIHGMEDDDNHAEAIADTPQKAIALAVIQGAKK